MATMNIPDVEWERHETEIRSFFSPLSRKRVKLVEIQKHMKVKHGLDATIPQWKRRLDKWQLTKRRDLKRKASALELDDTHALGHGTPLQDGAQMDCTNIYYHRRRSTLEYTASWWTKRFVTADFEYQLNDNLFASAQALFDHISLPRLGFENVNIHTRMMTEALFLLQRLNIDMQQADRHMFGLYKRHVTMIREYASNSIRGDFSAFARIAGFFLQINSVSSNSKPSILPILIGSLHDVCQDLVGYEHEASIMLRFLSLSIIYHGNPVRDVSPREWKMILLVQAAALICWLREEDEKYPPGHRRLRILFILDDIFSMSSLLKLRKMSFRGASLISKQPDASWVQDPELTDISKVVAEMKLPFDMDSSYSRRVRGLIKSSGVFSVINDLVWCMTKIRRPNSHNHSDLNQYEHLSGRFLFTVDDSVRGIISGEISDGYNCRFLQIHHIRGQDNGDTFHILMSPIVWPNSVFHTGIRKTSISQHTFVSELSMNSRLWFSLAEYTSGCTGNGNEDLQRNECQRFIRGYLKFNTEMVAFKCWNFCLHNLHKMWTHLFEFLKSCSNHPMTTNRSLDLCLIRRIKPKQNDFCALDPKNSRQEGLTTSKAQFKLVERYSVIE